MSGSHATKLNYISTKTGGETLGEPEGGKFVKNGTLTFQVMLAKKK